MRNEDVAPMSRMIDTVDLQLSFSASTTVSPLHPFLPNLVILGVLLRTSLTGSSSSPAGFGLLTGTGGANALQAGAR